MRAPILVTVLLLVGCQQVDANQGKYRCNDDRDCGQGYECRAQFVGVGRCYPVGQCVDVETCNGIDDTCDGRVDEMSSGTNQACDSAALGVCRAGLTTCVDAGLVCVSQSMPASESCNQLDDNCDGQTDEAYDLRNDPRHCGLCGHSCEAGTGCLDGGCSEIECSDGIDNDGDGQSDCLDSDCDGKLCYTGVSCTAFMCPGPG